MDHLMCTQGGYDLSDLSCGFKLPSQSAGQQRLDFIIYFIMDLEIVVYS